MHDEDEGARGSMRNDWFPAFAERQSRHVAEQTPHYGDIQIVSMFDEWGKSMAQFAANLTSKQLYNVRACNEQDFRIHG